MVPPSLAPSGIIGTRERRNGRSRIQRIIDRDHRPICSRNHKEPTKDEKHRTEGHGRPPVFGSGGAEVVPHPHVRFGLSARQRGSGLMRRYPGGGSAGRLKFDLHADEGTEESTDQTDQVVKEGDSLGDEEGDDTVEQNA
jgi:hypothetical protein